MLNPTAESLRSVMVGRDADGRDRARSRVNAASLTTSCFRRKNEGPSETWTLELLAERQHVAEQQVKRLLGAIEAAHGGGDLAMAVEDQGMRDGGGDRALAAGGAAVEADARRDVAPDAAADRKVEEATRNRRCSRRRGAILEVPLERRRVDQRPRPGFESDVDVEVAAVGPRLPDLGGGVAGSWRPARGGGKRRGSEPFGASRVSTPEVTRFPEWVWRARSW